jgi:hypothetical protein
MNSASATALAALLLFSMTGCSSSHRADAETTTTATATDPTASTAPAAAPDGTSTTVAADSSHASDDDKTGTGHLTITGEYSLDHDFTVSGCQAAPPGDGLLSGYHMTAKDGELPIALLAIALKTYDKDGPYEIAPTTREAAVGQAMNSGIMGPLTLMVMRDATTPLAFMQTPASKLTITVSDAGAKGTAEFSGLESPPTIEDLNTKNGAVPHGKRVSGSITWTCGSVGHIDAKMNTAVNGMFNKLIPPK